MKITVNPTKIIDKDKLAALLYEFYESSITGEYTQSELIKRYTKLIIEQKQIFNNNLTIDVAYEEKY